MRDAKGDVRMSRMLELPDELYERLKAKADAENVEVSELIERWLQMEERHFEERALCEGEAFELSADEMELWRRATRALLHGEEPPVKLNLEKIDAALESSDFPFETIEEAMSWLRGYQWRKDVDIDAGH